MYKFYDKDSSGYYVWIFYAEQLWNSEISKDQLGYQIAQTDLNWFKVFTSDLQV